ncbi:MAG: hypothetical protein LBQ02_02430 [Candidatus Nomurabacteria bacterium]|jgi:adenylate cyclase class IV|nr:hypothetical protein [Candidatus Nomurabacteria bacterium]
MAIEKEMRFFFSESKKRHLWQKLSEQFRYRNSFYEKTTMYDNPNPKLTFYSAKIDGRLRLRLSNEVAENGVEKSRGKNRCLVTWKQRLAMGRKGAIRKELEYEFNVNPEGAQNVIYILETVLCCPRIESYERIRHFFIGKDIEITLDEFPFGLMLEFELKKSTSEKKLLETVKKFGLNKNHASKNSCDDMYKQLCREHGIKPLPDIMFEDGTMPKA